MELEKAHDKFWVPKGSKKRWDKYWDDTRFMREALRCIPKEKRGVVVQAGGNIGAFPLFLAERFKRVFTFEPEKTNFACLARNVENCPNVEPYWGALGDTAGKFKMQFVEKGIGSHYMTDEPGDIRVWRIDDLDLRALDYLMLDVEGFELPAIRGGIETIKKYRPIIQVEDKGCGKTKGRGDTIEDIMEFLPEYKILERVHYDQVLVPKEWKPKNG